MIARTEKEKKIVRRWIEKGEAKIAARIHETYISKVTGRIVNYEAWIVVEEAA